MTKLSVNRYMAHPWHGISSGADTPKVVNAFIEMTPSDGVKYEIDKETGFLKVDRPQKFSNIVPALYGFIPRTYCHDKVAEFCNLKTGRTDITGDQDPVDICVLTERNITHGNILVPAIPIGGFRMIDDGEADDKIVAILQGDEVFDQWRSIGDCPKALINRLKHYFLTYKEMPGDQPVKKIEITDIYDKDEAYEVINRSREDYADNYSIGV